MQGRYRKLASLAEVLHRDRTRGVFGRRTPRVALASVTATLAVAAVAFAPDYIQLLNSAARTDHHELCGRPYKLAKPLAPQRIFRDPGSRGIRALAFCSNGSVLAAADGNGHVYLWSMASHKIVAVLHDPASKGVSAVAYRPRTRTLAAGDANGSVYLWQPDRAQPRRLRDPRSKGVRALAFSPGGRFLAVADANGHTYIWTMARRKIALTLHVARSGSVNAVTFNGAGTLIATGDASGQANVWAFSGKPSAHLAADFRDPGSKGVDAVAFQPRTRTLAAADKNGQAYLWPPGAQQPRVLTDAKPATMTAERFTPSGKFLATVDVASHLLFWDPASAKIIELLPLHGSGALRAVALSPDARRLAAGDVEGRIFIADTTRVGINVVLTNNGTPG